MPYDIGLEFNKQKIRQYRSRREPGSPEEGAIICNYLSSIYEEWDDMEKSKYYKYMEENLLKEAFSAMDN